MQASDYVCPGRGRGGEGLETWPSVCFSAEVGFKAEPARIHGPPLAEHRRRPSPVEGCEPWPLETGQAMRMAQRCADVSSSAALASPASGWPARSQAWPDLPPPLLTPTTLEVNGSAGGWAGAGGTPQGRREGEVL